MDSVSKVARTYFLAVFAGSQMKEELINLRQVNIALFDRTVSCTSTFSLYTVTVFTAAVIQLKPSLE